MELVLGILILLALCGSRAAKQGLTLLIGVPLGLLATIMLLGMIGSIPQVLTANWPFQKPASVAPPSQASPWDDQDRSCAAWTLAVLRQKADNQARAPHASIADINAMMVASSHVLNGQSRACMAR